jgi:hypothetical protein
MMYCVIGLSFQLFELKQPFALRIPSPPQGREALGLTLAAGDGDAVADCLSSPFFLFRSCAWTTIQP